MNINKTGVFTEFIRNHTYIQQERMYCTYSLQLACQRTEISSGLAVLVQNGLQVVYWPEFKPSGSFVLWTKYLIIKLLCYFFLLKLIRRKKTHPTTQLHHMKAAPVCTTSPMYPSSFIPAIFRHQRSSHKHPVKSVVLLRQSAAHNQLFIFAPSITQFILKKKKSTCYSQEYTNIYHSFPCSLQNQLQKLTAHYVQILPKYIKEPSSGTLPNSISHHLKLRSACSAVLPHQTLKSCRCLTRSVINSLWVGISAERS